MAPTISFMIQINYSDIVGGMLQHVQKCIATTYSGIVWFLLDSPM